MTGGKVRNGWKREASLPKLLLILGEKLVHQLLVDDAGLNQS